MARRAALIYLSIASPLLVVLFFCPGSFAGLVFTGLVMGYPVALITFSISTRGSAGPLAVPLAALFLILEAAGLGMFVLRDRVQDAPWIGGLPLTAAILIYGLWLAPLVLVITAYALTFDSFELRQEDLEQLEAIRRGDGDGS